MQLDSASYSENSFAPEFGLFFGFLTMLSLLIEF